MFVGALLRVAALLRAAPLTELVRAALLTTALAREVALLRVALLAELGAYEGGTVGEGRYQEAELTRTALLGRRLQRWHCCRQH